MMNKQELIAKAKAYIESDAIRRDFASDLAYLIEVDSVAGEACGAHPYGDKCAIALDRGLELGAKYGFKTVNHDYHCISLISGDNEREVGIASHLDVVPCGDGWSYPPYKLTVKDGVYIGRGTEDDKGPFCVSLYVMRFLKENGYRLPFSIRLIGGSDEEVGSSDLMYFSKVCAAPWFSFTPDSEFPVCIGEKNIVQLKLSLGRLPDSIIKVSGGTVSNAVPCKAEATVKCAFAPQSSEGVTVTDEGNGVYRLNAAGRTAHAANPSSGINAIAKLANYIISNSICDTKQLRLLATLDSFDGSVLGIARRDDDFGELTCVGSVLETSGNEAFVTFNIRAIPGADEEGMESVIAEAAAKYGATVKSFFLNPGYRFDASDKRVAALTNACETVLGKRCEPYTMGGGTYARELKNCVAFGATLPENYFSSDSANGGGAHEPDEGFSFDDVTKAFCIYTLSLLSLAEGIEDGSIN